MDIGLVNKHFRVKGYKIANSSRKQTTQIQDSLLIIFGTFDTHIPAKYQFQIHLEISSSNLQIGLITSARLIGFSAKISKIKSIKYHSNGVKIDMKI